MPAPGARDIQQSEADANVGACGLSLGSAGRHEQQPVAVYAAEAAHKGRWRPQELSDARMADILCSASQALTETLNLDTVLGTLLDYLATLVPFEGGNVCLLEPGSRMAPRATRGWAQLPDGQACQGRILDVPGRQRLEELFHTGSSILIEDRRRRPDWEPCRGLAYAQSCMVVPLVVDGHIIGLCELGRRQPGSFNRQYLRWVEALIGQAEVAIRNAQLFEQVQALSRHLVEAQENERRLIAHELHDEAGQALTSLKVQLKLLERQAGDPRAIREGTARLIDQVEAIMEGLHRLAAGLRPPSLDHLGLQAALGQYCASVGHLQGLTIQFEAVGVAERLPPEVETALYRIVQEALLNVVRHAQATEASVVLERRHDQLVAIVEDNGQGFDPAAVALKGRIGLLGIRERAQALGGTLTLDSAPGSGTTVLVEVPYADYHPHR
jgi:signal transduction histidine kinase